MKDKIVFWATNETDNEILVTLRLRAAENKVDIWTFDKKTLSEEFVEKMFQDWDAIDVSQLPEPHTHLERDMTEPSLLPEGIRPKNTEIVNRAEKEWFVRVLSLKLTMKLRAEVEQLWEQVQQMSIYDKETWDLARNYWNKVNQHFQARDLNREDTSLLRDLINKCFEKLKTLRKVEIERFAKDAQINAKHIKQDIEFIIGKVATSRNLGDLFEKLKMIQKDSSAVRLTKELRQQVRNQLNGAFDLVRNARRNSRTNKLEARLKGLENAIAKMDTSIRRDKESFNFQKGRQANSSGKLEMQLREAKIQMIKARIESKQTKLDDMYLTLENIKKRIDQERAKEEKERQDALARREAIAKANQKAAEERKAKELAKQKAEEERKAKELARKKAEEEQKAKEVDDVATQPQNQVEEEEPAVPKNQAEEEPLSIVTEEVATITETVPEEEKETPTPIEPTVAVVDVQDNEAADAKDVVAPVAEEKIVEEAKPLATDPLAATIVDTLSTKADAVVVESTQAVVKTMVSEVEAVAPTSNHQSSTETTIATTTNDSSDSSDSSDSGDSSDD